ncbi:unnamed protein product [Microthlaspi erraticum]|uniref:Uncharacterized protein n=1 Tax=Microthlaspi erraticum TaxID=1685480 RepID=A0A6D2I235_9BRAS|nr:unnamed protein product [Microthlaspi erraticum]
MDFIKTSSLRALIELTFQRNWNGLIWMSRKGVNQKSEDCPDGSIENQRPNRAVRLAEERMFRARPNHIRPTEVSAKVQTDRPITQSRPGKHVPRSAKLKRHATPRTMHPSEPGRTSHVRPRTIGQSHPPTTPADRIRPATTVPTRPRPDCPADRPDRPSQRRGRPEARFEAQISYFQARLNPKPPQKT